MAVLQIARIAGVEPAVGGEGLGGGDGLLVVTIGDGLAPQQDFLVVGYLPGMMRPTEPIAKPVRG